MTLDHDDSYGTSNCGSRASTRHLRSFAKHALSVLAGALLVGLLLAATKTPRLDSSQTLNVARLPQIASGKDERTGQPASWFNGDCGSSAQEAKARACVFDLVSQSWLPKDCLSKEDFEDTDLMYANKTWHWGLDNLREVSLDEVRRGEFSRVWTSMDWHLTHCSFIWKRLHRALLDPGRKVDSYTADYHHTSDCAHMIAELSPTQPVNSTGTRVYTKFPTC